MLKSRFFYLRHIAVMFFLCLFLFTNCHDSSSNDSNPTDEQKTWIEFKNLEEFPVTIYSDPARQVVFAEISANGTKKVSAEPAPMGRAFYPTFLLIYPIGTTGNVNISYNGPSITATVLTDKTNTVSIPKLESIVTNSAYIMLVNNSSFSLTLNEGSLEKSPLGGGSSLINSNQKASYEITPKSVSSYSVLRNGSTPVAFPDDLSEFTAGMAYVLTYDGTALTLTGQLPINTEITVPGNTFAMKLAWLQNNLLSNRSCLIEITADENIAPQNLSYSGKSGITIILSGGETMRTIGLSNNGSLFTIGSGVTLLLKKNITLKGSSDNDSPLVNINSDGSLVMNEGTIITSNTAAIESNSISYSRGGGVYVSGNFTMNGGEISGNTAYSSSNYDSFSFGGGVYVDESGKFTMNDGKISSNTALSSSSNYDSHSFGGGVYVDENGKFTMNGGEISGNTTDAYVSKYRYSHSYGGGMCGRGIMTGGVIYGKNTETSLQNYASDGGAALDGYVQYGTLSGNTFTRLGDLYTTDTTIRIVNGNLQTE